MAFESRTCLTGLRALTKSGVTARRVGFARRNILPTCRVIASASKNAGFTMTRQRKYRLSSDFVRTVDRAWLDKFYDRFY
jgi:hypothetical protein